MGIGQEAEHRWLERKKAVQKAKRKQRQALVRRISTVAAAAVVGIAITLTLVGNDPAITSSSSPDKTAMRYADIDSYISNMSDEELDALLQMYEADVMMQMEE